MKSLKHLVLPALTLLLASSGTSAQTVYRCGNSYSQTPCAGAVAVPAEDARTDAQRAAARQALASDKALAKDMEASRLKDEAMALAREKALASATAHKKPESKKTTEVKTRKKAGSSRTAKAKEPEFFTATDGATRSKKK
jgi:hypothetical protein